MIFWKACNLNYNPPLRIKTGDDEKKHDNRRRRVLLLYSHCDSLIINGKEVVVQSNYENLRCASSNIYRTEWYEAEWYHGKIHLTRVQFLSFRTSVTHKLESTRYFNKK